MPVLPVSMLVKNPLDRLGDAVCIGHRGEFLQQPGGPALRAHPAARVHRETLGIAPAPGDEAQVVDRRARAIPAAPRAGDLVLAWQLEGERVGQQELREAYHVRGHVEHLLRTHARQVAGSDIPHRVAAAALGRKSRFGQLRHGRMDTLDLHAVYLEILPAGEMQRAIAVRFRYGGGRSHLPGAEDSRRQTGTQHERPRFALLVNPLWNTERLEARRRDFATLELSGHPPKLLQIFRKVRWKAVYTAAGHRIGLGCVSSSRTFWSARRAASGRPSLM